MCDREKRISDADGRILFLDSAAAMGWVQYASSVVSVEITGVIKALGKARPGELKRK
jgi:hypothetical protein